MERNQKQKGKVIAIVAMFFLFAMISFVTNLAAPIGTIWKNNYEWSGMLGNLMNFLAYLFMGIPAGNLLVKIGYKKTALWAMVIGIAGLALQYLSSVAGTETVVFSAGADAVTLNFIIYLLGAFVCGFCVCMLNTVVNPMLNLLGGGVMPVIQNAIANSLGYMTSYWLVVAMLAYLLFYGLIGCKNVNKDIPVDDEAPDARNL